MTDRQAIPQAASVIALDAIDKALADVIERRAVVAFTSGTGSASVERFASDLPDLFAVYTALRTAVGRMSS